jgi:ABC-type nitrate/sulfonate/bicarbonate transport system substrate-binding protein
MEVTILPFIPEAVWDRIVSYSGAYLAALLLFSLVYSSAVSGGGDNTLYMTIIKRYAPLVLLTIPAAYIVAKKKGYLEQEQK